MYLFRSVVAVPSTESSATANQTGFTCTLHRPNANRTLNRRSIILKRKIKITVYIWFARALLIFFPLSATVAQITSTKPVWNVPNVAHATRVKVRMGGGEIHVRINKLDTRHFESVIRHRVTLVTVSDGYANSNSYLRHLYGMPFNSTDGRVYRGAVL